MVNDPRDHCLTMTSVDNVLDRPAGRCRAVYLLIVAIIVVSVCVTVIIVVTVSPWSAAPNKLSKTGVTGSTGGTRVIPDSDCIDVAVIGAGIGGAYTGWRLKDRGLAISVFEYSDRIGGRFLTQELPVVPGTYLELEAMRFQSGAHPIMNRTATEIGLNIIPFEFGYGNADETIWYTRGMRLRNTDLGTSKVPYKLQPSELKNPDDLMWNIFSENINFSSNTYPSLEEMYSLATSDGIPLYKMTMDNFYGRFTSREVYDYIYDTSGWGDSVGRTGALGGMKLWASFPGETRPYGDYKTIAGGMGMFPKTLLDKFKEANTSHKLHLNHQLLKIERRNAGGYHLTFRKTQTTDGITTPIQTGDATVAVCARKVILSAQKGCIQDIDFPAFHDDPEVVRNMDSLVDFPSGKVFLAYNSKWWKTYNSDITHTNSDLPNRQTYDWSTGTNNVSIILATYHDLDLTPYWRELSQFGTPIPGSLPGVNAVTDVVKERLEKYLSLIYNYKQEDIPEAVGGGMMLWDSYPFYAGWHYFKHGFDERRVRELVQKPSKTDDVYIVSNSWAADSLQGWAEGSLVTVDEVIKKYF